MFKWKKNGKDKNAETPKQPEKSKPVSKKVEKAPSNDDKGFKLPEIKLGGLFGKAKDTGKKAADKAGELAKTATDATKSTTNKLTETGKATGRNVAKKTEDIVGGVKKGAKTAGDTVGGAAKSTVDTHKKNTTGNMLADFFMPIPVPKKDMKDIQKKKGGNTPPKP